MSNSVTNDLAHFAKQCLGEISQLAEDEIVQEGVTKFQLKLEQTTGKSFAQTQFPVQSKLDGIAKTPYTFNFHEIAQQLKWRPSPRTDSEAKVIALCSFNEMLKLGDLVAGLMFMTPNQIYPEHKHPPQEVYFVLAGTACWLYGGEKEYRQQKPGDVIYNHSHDLHGMKTQNESLLALYFLWGNKAKVYNY